jgi:hypothetical protein
MSKPLAAFWQQAFGIVQALDPVYDTTQAPVWRINDDEAKMLGESTEQYIKSFPKVKKSGLQKFIQRHMPLIAFTASIVIVVQPRAQYSFALHQRGMAGHGARFAKAASAQRAAEHNKAVHRPASAGDAGGGPGYDEVDAAFDGS